MKKIKALLKNNYILEILFGIIFVALLMSTLKDLNIIPAYNSLLSLISLVFLIAIYVLYFKYRNQISTREKIICAAGAILFSSFYVIGYQLNNFNLILVEYRTPLKIFSLFLLAYILLAISFANLYKINISHKINQASIIHKFFSKYLYIWIFIIVLNIPYLVLLNPAVLSADSMNIVTQSVGLYDLNARHPVFYTLLVSVFTRLGGLLNLDIYYGILFFAIFQTLVMSAMFAFTVFYSYKLKINPLYIIVMCLFYALFPVFPIYSVTVWKGVVFGGSMLLFILILYRAKNEEAFLKSKKNVFVLGASALAVLLFRTNGIMVIVLTTPFVFVLLKKHIKKVLAAMLIPLVIYILFITVGYSLLKVTSVGSTEAFTIPYQHMARILYENKELTDEEADFLDNVFIDLDREYVPRKSDIARVYNADVKYFQNNEKEFFGNWLKFVKKYPGTLVKSFLNNNYGYWYPGVDYWVVASYISDWGYPVINVERKISKNLGMKIVGSMAASQIFKIFANTGLGFWAFLFLFLYVYAKKEKSKYLLFIPGFALWLSLLFFAPVHAEFRYIYGLFTSLPFIVGIVFFGGKDSGNDKNIETT